MSAGRVLVVEDDRLTRRMIRANLAHEGYEVVDVGSTEEALAAAGRFDAILLDYMLPGADGLSALRALRRAGVGAPVLMLTARSETTLKVAALDGGADDFLTKPFHVAELCARVRALIRRARAPIEPAVGGRVRVGVGEVDLDARLFLSDAGERVSLGEKEAGLLAAFLRRPGAVLRRADLLDEVWGMDADPVERTVDNYVVRLRRLVEPDPLAPRVIRTVRGEGYQYVPSDGAEGNGGP